MRFVEITSNLGFVLLIRAVWFPIIEDTAVFIHRNRSLSSRQVEPHHHE